MIIQTKYIYIKPKEFIIGQKYYLANPSLELELLRSIQKKNGARVEVIKNQPLSPRILVKFLSAEGNNLTIRKSILKEKVLNNNRVKAKYLKL
tara:strand:- start:133 stop:411 length:279 start_codon:yes stop_codon:yes gene_type:complete